MSGKDPFTGKHLHASLAIPDMVSTMLRDKQKPVSLSRRKHIALYDDEAMQSPRWLVHPDFRERVDVVAIPLDSGLLSEYRLFAINDIAFDTDISPEVSDDVFVVGYPFSDITYLQLPIWKKGSIASEPIVDLDQTPKLFIDTATRPGLSGSPVILQRIGVHRMNEDGTMSDRTFFGRARNMLGVYSGRVGHDEFKAQLGIVWKAQVILEIIKGGIKGNSVHHV